MKLPAPLQRDHSETSLDGHSLVLRPVYAPFPWPFDSLLASAATGTVVWMIAACLLWVPILVVLALGSVNTSDLLGASLALACMMATLPGLGAFALALPASTYWRARQPTGLELELKAHQLIVRELTGWPGLGEEVQVPLADLVDARMDGDELVVSTHREQHRFVLPDRSTRTYEAVNALLSEHLRRGDEQRGEVPRSLQRLMDAHEEPR